MCVAHADLRRLEAALNRQDECPLPGLNIADHNSTTTPWRPDFNEPCAARWTLRSGAG
jgi:hypothetical protein